MRSCNLVGLKNAPHYILSWFYNVLHSDIPTHQLYKFRNWLHIGSIIYTRDMFRILIWSNEAPFYNGGVPKRHLEFPLLYDPQGRAKRTRIRYPAEGDARDFLRGSQTKKNEKRFYQTQSRTDESSKSISCKSWSRTQNTYDSPQWHYRLQIQ